jgi:hypothetical protein
MLRHCIVFGAKTLTETEYRAIRRCIIFLDEPLVQKQKPLTRDF